MTQLLLLLLLLTLNIYIVQQQLSSSSFRISHLSFLLLTFHLAQFEVVVILYFLHRRRFITTMIESTRQSKGSNNYIRNH